MSISLSYCATSNVSESDGLSGPYPPTAARLTTKYDMRLGSLLVPAGSYALRIVPSHPNPTLNVFDQASANVGSIDLISNGMPTLSDVSPTTRSQIVFQLRRGKVCSVRHSSSVIACHPADEIGELHFIWAEFDVYAIAKLPKDHPVALSGLP